MSSYQRGDATAAVRVLAWLGCCLAAGAAATSSVESEVSRRWKGAWVVIGVNTISGCGGNYTNNEVHGRLVSAKGGELFGPGELGVVHKVNLHRERIEVFVDLVEPVLTPRQDGPFTLYDELHCKVELRFGLEAVDSRRVEALDEFLGSFLERHPEVGKARSSEAWNRRVRESYPPDYQKTVTEYEAWKVVQFNGEVKAQLEESIEEAARLVDRIEDGPDYLAGFAAGVDDARDVGWSSDCKRLLSMSEASWVKRAPKGSGGAWKEAFGDGQRLVFHVERARRMKRCFIPPPI